MSNPTPQARLLALINAKNTKQWQDGQLIFGAPSDVGDGSRNTVVTVTALTGLPYSGAREIYYNRVDLSEAPGEASVEFELVDQVTTHDLVAAMAQRFGVDLSAVDIENSPLPAADEFGTITVTLAADSNSYYWTGSLELTLAPAVEELADAIPEAELDGFTKADLEV